MPRLDHVSAQILQPFLPEGTHLAFLKATDNDGTIVSVSTTNYAETLIADNVLYEASQQTTINLIELTIHECLWTLKEQLEIIISKIDGFVPPSIKDKES